MRARSSGLENTSCKWACRSYNIVWSVFVMKVGMDCWANELSIYYLSLSFPFPSSAFCLYALGSRRESMSSSMKNIWVLSMFNNMDCLCSTSIYFLSYSCTNFMTSLIIWLLSISPFCRCLSVFSSLPCFSESSFHWFNSDVYLSPNSGIPGLPKMYQMFIWNNSISRFNVCSRVFPSNSIGFDTTIKDSKTYSIVT